MSEILERPNSRKPEPWQRYAPVVLSFFPDADENEQRCRGAIMHMRDRANQVRQKSVTWAADAILATMEQLGLAFASSAAEPHKIEAIRRQMAELFRIAVAIDVACGE